MKLNWDDKLKAWLFEGPAAPSCSYCHNKISDTPFHACELHQKIFCNSCIKGSILRQDHPGYIPAYCHNRRYLPFLYNGKSKDMGSTDCTFLQVKAIKIVDE